MLVTIVLQDQQQKLHQTPQKLSLIFVKQEIIALKEQLIKYPVILEKLVQVIEWVTVICSHVLKDTIAQKEVLVSLKLNAQQAIIAQQELEFHILDQEELLVQLLDLML